MARRSPDPAIDPEDGWVVLGVITKPKGVRGQVRITSFTERPADLVAYGPLFDRPDGRVMEVSLRETLKGGVVIAAIAGITDRDAAEALRGIELHVPRAALPEVESDEYYHADLVGLDAVDTSGVMVGRIVALHNFGAGEILEVSGGGESLMLPFNSDTVPEIDIPGGSVVIAPPIEAGDVETGDKENET